MIVVLSGGTGTPKFLEGLRYVIPDEKINVIVNTADDFIWNGLYISPDLDTVVYLFANLLDTNKYWGVKNDTFNFLEQGKLLGLEKTWFNIGDKDLAIHILRTWLLKKGWKLHEITKYICKRLNVRANILPMSNDKVRTYVLTEIGELHIQEYIVLYKLKPEVYGIKFKGIEKAKPTPGLLNILKNAKLIIIGPSNPVNSIGPIVNIKEIRNCLRKLNIPKIIISPLVQDKPISGVADKFMKILGYESTPIGLYEMFKDFITGIVIDKKDQVYENELKKFGIDVLCTNIIMNTAEDKIRLAKEVIQKFLST